MPIGPFRGLLRPWNLWAPSWYKAPGPLWDLRPLWGFKALVGGPFEAAGGHARACPQSVPEGYTQGYTQGYTKLDNIQGGPKKTIPLKNRRNFVAVTCFLLKFYKLV